MIALGEDPSVPTRNVTNLDDSGFLRELRVKLIGWNLTLEGDAEQDVRSKSERSGARTICAVSANNEISAYWFALNAERTSKLDCCPFPHLRTAAPCVIQQMGVEPRTLSHPHTRCGESPSPRGRATKTDVERVDPRLDHRSKVNRTFPLRTRGDTAPAGLVTRKPGFVNEEHGDASPCQPRSRRRAGRPTAHD